MARDNLADILLAFSESGFDTWEAFAADGIRYGKTSPGEGWSSTTGVRGGTIWTKAMESSQAAHQATQGVHSTGARSLAHMLGFAKSQIGNIRDSSQKAANAAKLGNIREAMKHHYSTMKQHSQAERDTMTHAGTSHEDINKAIGKAKLHAAAKHAHFVAYNDLKKLLGQ